MENSALGTRTRGASPQWRVDRTGADGLRLTFLLVDVARSGVERVAVRCAGCRPVTFTDQLCLDDGVAPFTVELAERGRALLVPPTVTLAWFVARTGSLGSWSAHLEPPDPRVCGPDGSASGLPGA